MTPRHAYVSTHITRPCTHTCLRAVMPHRNGPTRIGVCVHSSGACSTRASPWRGMRGRARPTSATAWACLRHGCCRHARALPLWALRPLPSDAPYYELLDAALIAQLSVRPWIGHLLLLTLSCHPAGGHA